MRSFYATAAILLAVGVPALAFVVSGPPPYATRGVAFSGQAIAGGGTAPYTFSVSPGTLPPGLQMDSTGLISGTPMHAGTYTFTITAVDSNNVTASGSASVIVAGTTLTMSPAGVPQGHVGVTYSPITVAVIGGVPPYTVSVTSPPPPGITFDPVALSISGTPTTGGNYSLEFMLSDSAGDVSTFAYPVSVLDVLPTTQAEGELGVAYSASFAGIGFSVTPTISVSGGTLPPGLSFSPANNVISGTPTKAGTFTFTMHAAGGGATADRVYFITILASPPISIGGIPSGTVGVPYSQQVPVFNATPPVTFTQTSGTITPGLMLSTSDLVSGTPTKAGSYGVGVSVHDSTGQTLSASISMVFVPPPLSVAPATIPDGAVGQSYSVTFIASGGLAPYHYTSGGTVPGLALDAASGVFSGKPTSGGTYHVTIFVEDNASATGSQSYTFNITGPTPPFTLTPLTLPNGIAGKIYNWGVNAGGDQLPVTFTVSSGTPPPGLVFTQIPDGVVINHVPTTPGLYQFQLTGTDTNNRSVSQDYSINIASQAITVGPSSIPGAISTVPYSITFTATGGTPPYVYSMIGTAAGPQLSPDGMLSGIPNSGQWSFTIQATDSMGVTGSWDYLFVVAPATLIVTPLQLPAGALGTPYSVPMVGNEGTPPYTFSLSSGPLPAGMTLTPSGALAGTPQQAGIFNNISITAHDSLGAAGSRTYQFVINGVPITLGPSSLPDAVLNQPYSAQLTASGGTPPYTFTRPSANAWVPGLQVNADGSITGSPTNAGAALLDFTVVATDVNGSSGTHEFFINLRTGTLSLTPTVLPSATAGSAYSVTLTASGGHAPYTFSLPVGIPLPAGLSLSPGGTLSGTPAIAGNDPFVIQVQDSNSANGSQPYLLNVAPAAISVTPTSLPPAATGTSYSTVITASGGIPPYLFFLATGSNLPQGMELSVGGELVGTPTVAGSYPFTVLVHDNALDTATFAYVLNVTNSCSYAISPGGKVFPSTGGTGTITITTGANCPWTIGNVPNWVTLSSASSGTGNATAAFQVGVNNGPDLSSVVTAAGMSFTVQQQAASIAGMNFAGSLPHTATAENWTTTFTLVANGTEAAQTRLSLFGNDGSPLPVEFNLPQAPSASGPLVAASLDHTIAAHALVVLDGLGPTSAPVQTGSAQLGATGTVGGFAIFHYNPNGQEAVAPLESRGATAYILAFDNTSGTATGVAINSVSTQAVNVPVIIRDDTGAQIGTDTISLAANGHLAFTLGVDKYPATVNIRGTVEFDTPAGAQLGALGIRIPVAHTFTTLPALAK